MDSASEKQSKEKQRKDRILEQAEAAVKAAFRESPIKPGASEFIELRDNKEKPRAGSKSLKRGTETGRDKPAAAPGSAPAKSPPSAPSGPAPASKPGKPGTGLEKSVLKLENDMATIRKDMEARIKILEGFAKEFRDFKVSVNRKLPERYQGSVRERIELLSHEVKAIKSALSEKESASHQILRKSLDDMRKELESLKERMLSLPTREDYEQLATAIKSMPAKPPDESRVQAAARPVSTSGQPTIEEIRNRIMHLPKPGEAAAPGGNVIYSRVNALEKRIDETAKRSNERLSHVLEALDVLSSKLASGITQEQSGDATVKQLAGSMEFFTKRFSGELSDIRSQMDRILSLEKSINEIREQLKEKGRPALPRADAAVSGPEPERDEKPVLPLPPLPPKTMQPPGQVAQPLAPPPGALPYRSGYIHESASSGVEDLELLREEVQERLARNQSRDRIVKDLVNAGFEEELVLKAMSMAGS